MTALPCAFFSAVTVEGEGRDSERLLYLVLMILAFI